MKVTELKDGSVRCCLTLAELRLAIFKQLGPHYEFAPDFKEPAIVRVDGRPLRMGDDQTAITMTLSPEDQQ